MMPRAFLLTMVLMSALLVCTSAFGDTPASVTQRSINVQGVLLHTITVDLSDPAVSVDVGLASGGISRNQSFSSIVNRDNCVAAITGTYFDTRTLIPVGTIVKDGKRVVTSAIGSVFLLRKSENYVYAFNGDTLMLKRHMQATIETGTKGIAANLDGAVCALRGGPLLLKSGQIVLDYNREGFRDPGLFGARTRMIVAKDSANRLMLISVQTPVTFEKSARIMQKIGCIDAICMDGGTSSAMYFNGRYIRYPGRALTNVIEVKYCPVTEENADYVVKTDRRYTVGTKKAAAQTYDCRVVLTNLGELSLFCEVVFSGGPEGLLAFIPVNRTQLTGLKRLENSKDLVHVSPNIKIVHNLVPKNTVRVYNKKPA